MRFLVHGSIAYDLLFSCESSFLDAIQPESLDHLSVSFVAQHFQRHHGGTAANISWNLKLLGQDPMIVGSVGYNGGEYLALLRMRGIATDFIAQHKDVATATAIIATDSDERQIAFFHSGADVQGTMPDIADLSDEISLAIVSPRDVSAMLEAVKQCFQLKIPYLFDPGQQAHHFGQEEFRNAVKKSRGVVMNAYEWEIASKKLAWGASEVIKACGLLIITQGEKGAILAGRDDTITVSACKPDTVVNPVGAGDAFRAGLLIGLAKGWSLHDTGRLGCAIASFVVEQEGAMMDKLDIEDVRGRAKENYAEELPEF